VRHWVANRYAARGRPSIDLVVFFRLQLIDTAWLNLAHRWSPGYHLDEPLPDHSSLIRLRQRLGLPIVRRFFDHGVQVCLDAGLVWGQYVVAGARPGSSCTPW
jgi:hypothetical protein